MNNKIVVFLYEVSLWNNNGYSYAFGLYKWLSKYSNICCIVPRTFAFLKEDRIVYNGNLSANVVVPSADFVLKKGIHDIFDLADVADEDETFVKKVQMIVDDPDVIICDSFVWVKFVSKVFPKVKIVVRSLDVEQDKIDQSYASNSMVKNNNDRTRNIFRNKIVKLEETAYKKADFSIMLTENDADRLTELYGIHEERKMIIPLCVWDIQNYVNYYPRYEHASKEFKIAFLGFLVNDAWNSVKIITNLARNLPDIEFHIIGKCIGDSVDLNLKNLIIHGQLPEDQKNKILCECDGALNLSMQTYGMNAKILDYMMVGCPIISTETGTRGYHMQAQVHYFPCKIDTLVEDINKFCNLREQERINIARNAYNLLFENNNYNIYWKKLSKVIGVDNNIVSAESQDDINNKSTIIIFGCGIAGEQVLETIKGHNHKMILFTDNNPRFYGEHLGFEVISTDDAFRRVNSEKDSVIVIASINIEYIRQMYVQAYTAVKDVKKLSVFYEGNILMQDIDMKKLGVKK